LRDVAHVVSRYQIKTAGYRLQCELCELWYHAECQDVSKEAYRVLTRNESMHWFCKRCNASVNKVIMNVSRLQSKVEDIEENVSLIKHELETMKADAKDELNGMKSKISPVGD